MTLLSMPCCLLGGRHNDDSSLVFFATISLHSSNPREGFLLFPPSPSNEREEDNNSLFDNGDSRPVSCLCYLLSLTLSNVPRDLVFRNMHPRPNSYPHRIWKGSLGTPFYVRPLFPPLSPCNIKNRVVDHEAAGATHDAKISLGLGCVTQRGRRVNGISTPSPLMLNSLEVFT